MAELPELGKHCFLEKCKKLDYTPFFCPHCSQYYCGEHRLLHGCDSSRNYDPSTASTSSAPLRPFLCSYEGCFAGESIKIVCPYCELNFCLQHRHPPEHSCQHLPNYEEAAKIPRVFERLRKMHEALDPLVMKEKEDARNKEKCLNRDKSPITAVEQARIDKINAMRSKLAGKMKIDDKPLDNTDEAKQIAAAVKTSLPPFTAQQEKEDRVAAMKLKMANKLVPGTELQILFIEWPSGRKPILVHKAWTLGKVISMAKESLKLTFQVKMFYKRGSKDSLSLEDIVGNVVKEEQTLVFIPL